jgi:hypothetical protein
MGGWVAVALRFDLVMRTPRYPLEPLVELRDRKVNEARGDLASAARERSGAERRRLELEQKCEEHSAAVSCIRGAEDESLARGELRAADLARVDAWEVGVAVERDVLATEVERARVEETGMREREARALDEVASRSAEAQVVANDRVRWRDALHRRVEAREEEASSEAWAAKPHTCRPKS